MLCVFFNFCFCSCCDVYLDMFFSQIIWYACNPTSISALLDYLLCNRLLWVSFLNLGFLSRPLVAFPLFMYWYIFSEILNIKPVRQNWNSSFQVNSCMIMDGNHLCSVNTLHQPQNKMDQWRGSWNRKNINFNNFSRYFTKAWKCNFPLNFWSLIIS